MFDNASVRYHMNDAFFVRRFGHTQLLMITFVLLLTSIMHSATQGQTFFGQLSLSKTMNYDATTVVRFKCHETQIENFEKLTKLLVFAKSREEAKLEVVSDKHSSIPNCCFYVARQGFPSYNGGPNAIPLEDPRKRIFEMKLVNGQFETKLFHLRPYIDEINVGKGSIDEINVGNGIKYENPKDNLIGVGTYTGPVGYWDSPDEEAPLPFTYLGNPPDRAWVIARHYASITGEDGVATIKYLPSNVPMKFRVFHPYLDAAIPGCKIGNDVIDEHRCVTLTLQPGLNDLGEIDLSDSVAQYVNALMTEQAVTGKIREKVLGISK